MKQRAIIAAVLVVAGAAGATYVASEKARAPAPAYAMCVVRGARPGAELWRGPVLASAVRTLDERERASLEEALSLAITRREARENPFFDDIEGVDPDASVEAWLRSAPPFVATARAALRTRACGADGFCAWVRPEREPCPEGSSEATGEDDARARFLAWPWGHALRLRAANEGDARERAALLRGRIRTSRRIALVLTAEDEAITRAPPYERLHDLWQRASERKRSARSARSANDARAPLVGIAPGEIVVIPRLETIDDDRAFEAEIHEAAPGLERIARVKYPIRS